MFNLSQLVSFLLFWFGSMEECCTHLEVFTIPPLADLIMQYCGYLNIFICPPNERPQRLPETEVVAFKIKTTYMTPSSSGDEWELSITPSRTSLHQIVYDEKGESQWFRRWAPKIPGVHLTPSDLREKWSFAVSGQLCYLFTFPTLYIWDCTGLFVEEYEVSDFGRIPDHDADLFYVILE